MEVSPPTGEVTMVVADIGKWELLWEDSSVPMVKVMNLYSMELRKEMRRRGGFEVSMEGRICRVAFQGIKKKNFSLSLSVSSFSFFLLILLECPQILSTHWNGVCKCNSPSLK